jgi:hypothetical protein
MAAAGEADVVAASAQALDFQPFVVVVVVVVAQTLDGSAAHR